MPLPQMRARLVGWTGRWWWAPLLALLIPVLVSWPAVTVAADHVLSRPTDPDLGCGLWWPEAFARSLGHANNPFFRPELSWPEGQDTRLLLWNFLPQVLMLPLVALGRPLALNASALMWASLNGLACCWLGWTVSRSRLGAAVALVAGASALYGFFEGASGRPEQALFAPVALYIGAWVQLNERSSTGRLAFAGLALALAGATYWFYAYFLILMSPLLARSLRSLVVVGAFSALFVVPFLLPVGCALAEGGGAYSAMLDSGDGATVRAVHASIGADAWLGVFGPPLRDLGGRFSVLMLPAVIFGLWRRRWRLALLAGLAVLLGMGPLLRLDAGTGDASITLPMAWLAHLPGWERFWWPYRWLGVAIPAFAALAAMLPRRTWQAALLGSALLLEAGIGLRGLVWSPYPSPPAVQGPAVLVPLGATSNALVGLLPTGTRVDAGLAFSAGPQVRGEAWEQRRVESPLMRALDTVSEGGRAPRLSDEELTRDGFRSVVVQRALVSPRALVQLERLLGEPEVDGLIVVYRLPEPP